MTYLKQITLAAVLSLTVNGAASAADCQAQDDRHAGLYELQDVMEVGSAIWLGSNGRFEYMMAFGAVDEVAMGCWRDNGATVELVPTDMRVSQGGTKFKRLKLKVKSTGELIRSFGVGQDGTYVRVRR